MAKDKDYRKMICTRRWQMLRREVLTAHPLCERCKADGVIAPATEVHHCRPVEYGLNFNEKRRLMFDPGNLMALCHNCHVKTHTEMGRSGKAATRRRVDAQVAATIVKFFNDT